MTAKQRKTHPVHRGLLLYFPNACMAVSHCSYVCNEQHNPGQEMHWAKEKSADHLDALCRHALEPDAVDADGILHATKIAWRALANLETKLAELEMQVGQPLNPST